MLRTDKNVDKFMDGLEKVIVDPESQWYYDEAFYQGGTDREIESINVYNEVLDLLVIFKRSTGEFITLCQPTDKELKALVNPPHNFGGQEGWFSGQAKNLPPKVKSEQNVADQMTPIDSFESHVMGMTPTPYEFSGVDEEENAGFTPLTSFESDVLGITPLDSSASDDQI
jgi:hypothetical protein